MREVVLDEFFRSSHLSELLTWYCEPNRWEIDEAENCLRIRPDAQTDFWQQTHYGFSADNGHFLYTTVNTDFVMTTEVRFHPANQYDQAGLMVWFSPSCWLKTSVEYEPGGPNRLGAVVTNSGYSDWSTQDFPEDCREVRLRVRREGVDYIVDASAGSGSWSQIRLARLLDDRKGANVRCGVYACSPKGEGFAAEFLALNIVRGRIDDI
ncbi:MAG: DUF1349 domain-containing protein [Candidatus Hydrogenedentes bacterium]|nr:DUF1349 domain-containing protein [Candidatus Hydrogenedentota bacterium]